MSLKGPDFRRFLQDRQPPLVLPVVDPRSPYIWASASRQLRLENRAAQAGYYQVMVRGRRATIGAAAEPLDLSKMPQVLGHAWGRRLVTDQGLALPVSLAPGEFSRFAPLSAVVWGDGTAIFASERFETGVEEETRRAYEDEIPPPRGIPASLLCAYIYAVLEKVGRQMGERWRPVELQARAALVAERGHAGAREILEDLRERRRREEEAAAARRREQEMAEARQRAVALAFERAAERTAREADAARRREVSFGHAPNLVEDALQGSGASLLECRRLGENLEVRWRFLGQRFVTLVDPADLRVVDSGICLQNHDRELNLWSLPSTVRQAVDDGVLHITRWA